MPEHTPGPWEAGGSYYPAGGGIGVCEITPMGEFSILAEVFLPVPGKTAHGEGEANARLIAAAPDLLEAIHRIEGVLFGVPSGDTGLMFQECYDITQRALDKIARGAGQ